MEKRAKSFVAIAVVFSTLALIGLMAQRTDALVTCRSLSQLEMDNLNGGAKHCTDDTNCSNIPCTMGTVYFYYRVNQGITGRTCGGNPAVVCTPDTPVVCAWLYDGCTRDCAWCYEYHYTYSYRGCYSSS